MKTLTTRFQEILKSHPDIYILGIDKKLLQAVREYNTKTLTFEYNLEKPIINEFAAELVKVIAKRQEELI